MIIFAVFIVGAGSFCYLHYGSDSELYMEWYVLAALYGLALMLIAIVVLYRVRISVDAEGVRVKGIVSVSMRYDDIVSCEIVDVHAIRQFCGYGERWVPGKWGIIACGANRGVQIVRKKGLKVVITSAYPEEFCAAVCSHMSQ